MNTKDIEERKIIVSQGRVVDVLARTLAKKITSKEHTELELRNLLRDQISDVVEYFWEEARELYD